MSFDVVVLGSLHMDIIVSAPNRPRRGETVTGDAWSLKPGGKGGNQAVEAALAGARTAMIGAVGGDAFGEALVLNLEDHGVDASHVVTHKASNTGISAAITDAGGDYGAVIVSGVNLSLDGRDMDAANSLLAGASWLLLQQEVPDAANLAAAHAARRNGVKTILNAAPSRTFLGALHGLVDILVVNEIEAEMMGAPAIDSLTAAGEAASSLLRFAAATVVTAGAAGAAIATRGGLHATIVGHPVSLVSTHGAGDCFIGTLAAQQAAGASLEAAARYANATAALRVSSPAGSSRYHNPAAVRELLGDTEPPKS